MINVRISALILFVCLVSGQDRLYYDGSEHMGSEQVMGAARWNTDMFLGPVLIDGTLNFFPARFGPALAGEMSDTYDPEPVITRVGNDTTAFRTTMDYRMGDYDLDQLEITGEYLGDGNRTRIVGFKRSFAGNGFPAQYLRLDGRNVPLQQSYLLNYISRSERKTVNASVLLLNGDFNLIENDFETYGRISDRSLGGGYYSRMEFNGFSIRGGVSQFHQQYNSEISFLPDRSGVKLSRQRLVAVLDDINIHNWNLSASSALHTQGVTHGGKRSVTRNWGELLVSAGSRSIEGDAGIIITPGKKIPFGGFKVSFGRKRLNVTSVMKVHQKPGHALISESGDWETWSSASVNLTGKIGDGAIGVSARVADAYDVMILNYDGGNWSPVLIDNRTSGITLYGTYTLFNYLNLDVSWIHSDRNSLLSDGIGDRIRGKLSFRKYISFLQIDLAGEIAGERILNRNNEIGFDPYWGIPVVYGPAPIYGSGYTDIQGKLEATISSMTLYGIIRNIPNYLGSNSSLIDLEDTWIQNNAFLPPTGKMVLVGVTWHFRN